MLSLKLKKIVALFSSVIMLGNLLASPAWAEVSKDKDDRYFESFVNFLDNKGMLEKFKSQGISFYNENKMPVSSLTQLNLKSILDKERGYIYLTYNDDRIVHTIQIKFVKNFQSETDNKVGLVAQLNLYRGGLESINAERRLVSKIIRFQDIFGDNFINLDDDLKEVRLLASLEEEKEKIAEFLSDKKLGVNLLRLKTAISAIIAVASLYVVVKNFIGAFHDGIKEMVEKIFEQLRRNPMPHYTTTSRPLIGRGGKVIIGLLVFILSSYIAIDSSHEETNP